MGRVLGVDYGSKRIGLALSDEGRTFAFESEIWDARDFFGKIAAFVREKEIETIALGFPLSMAGKHTRETKEVLAFKKKIADSLPDIPVVLVDERMTSKAGAKIKAEQGLKQTTKNIDSLSAQIFLQNYLDKQKNSNVPG